MYSKISKANENLKQKVYIFYQVWIRYICIFAWPTLVGCTVLRSIDTSLQCVSPFHTEIANTHDDVIKWKHFPRYWPFVRGIHPGEVPSQRPVTRRFDVFLDQRMYKRWSEQPWGWWFETPSWSLWRHCNAMKSCVLVNKCLPTLHIHKLYRCCWWAGKAVSQAIIKHDTDLHMRFHCYFIWQHVV